MPTTAQDPKCNNKKLHIGNDHVVIVFKDGFVCMFFYERTGANFLSSAVRFQPYARNTVGGAVNFVDIVVEPLDDMTYKVNMLVKVRFFVLLVAFLEFRLLIKCFVFFLMAGRCGKHVRARCRPCCFRRRGLDGEKYVI
jgi:hypothetical protein